MEYNFSDYPSAIAAIKMEDFTRMMRDYIDQISPTGHRDIDQPNWVRFDCETDAASFYGRFPNECLALEVSA